MLNWAHMADLHIEEGPRFDENIRCINYAVKDAKAKDVVAFLLAGDIFKKKSTPAERNAFALIVRSMAEHAPVVIIRGNHDRPGDLEIFGKLECDHEIQVFERPGKVYVGGLAVYAFPHFDKSSASGWLDTQLSIEQTDMAVIQIARNYLAEWRTDLLQETVPAVFLAHPSMEGATLSNSETLSSHGIQLCASDIDIGFDAGNLGHIHHCQPCNAKKTIWYSGNPARGDCGEEKDAKGYLIHSIAGRGAELHTEFRETPTRKMITIEADCHPEFGFSFDCDILDLKNIVAGAEVRLRVTVPEDKRADAQILVERFERDASGAYSIQVEIRTIPVTRVRSEEIATAQTLEDKLKAYHIATEAPPEGDLEEIFAKLKEVELEVA